MSKAMWLRQWFRPPRHLLALFLVITLVPAFALGWLTWQLFQQDRALENQRVQEHLEHAADLAAAGMQRALAQLDEPLDRLSVMPDVQLAAAAAQHANQLTTDTLLVILRPGELEAYPPGRLLYSPVAPASPEPAAGVFAAAEAFEFQQHDYAKAIAACQELARSRDLAVRAGALLRLARNYRKARQIDSALAAYTELARLGALPVGGLPAELLARHERCDLLEETNRLPELQQEAQALGRDLRNARWQLARAAYLFYSEGTGRRLHTAASAKTPAEALSLAEGVDSLWQEWQRIRQSEGDAIGRRSVEVNGDSVLLLWRGTPRRLVALAAGPRCIAEQWRRNGQALIERQNVQLAWTGAEGRVVLGDLIGDLKPQVLRKAADTQLPWNLRVASADPQLELANLAGRRRLLLIGTAMLAILVTAGGYLIARAVQRELEVARLQSDFVSAVSHEFRTPLALLRQLSELLSDGRVPSEQHRHHYYQGIQRAGERLQRLVEGLLDFGRMEAGAQVYHFQTLDAAALVRSVAEEFGREAEERGYHVGVAVPDVLPCLRADQEALTRALWNLLDNAVKYSPECKTVWVEAACENSRVAIRVRDRGLGIAPEEQKKIFKKFVRGARATSLAKGTGLGLTIVRHIIAAHHGEIRVESRPGAGSTFTILLPQGN